MAAREKATFAAGCFWGVEEAFRTLPGVISTTVGYTGGTTQHPTYEQVCTGTTGHMEAVEIQYDPSVVSYDDLLKFFWTIHDPTSLDKQGPDVGSQYRSVIFYHSNEQKEKALKSKDDLQQSGVYTHKIVTEILPAQPFYKAEEYHQQYIKKQSHE